MKWNGKENKFKWTTNNTMHFKWEKSTIDNESNNGEARMWINCDKLNRKREGNNSNEIMKLKQKPIVQGTEKRKVKTKRLLV